MFSRPGRVHIEEKKASHQLEKIIQKIMTNLNYHNYKELIVLCIGTDRSTGDCLGPLTGSMLEKSNLPIEIIGNIDHPVHASNLDQMIKKINRKYTAPFIIAVDAGLGKKSSVGYIDVKKGPLKPGTGVNKELTEIGNMHITGLVNVGGYMEYLVLQSTRLSIVMKMAQVISNGLNRSISSLYQKKNAID